MESFVLDQGRIVAGLDEVGRGALAGPVVAAIVAASPGYEPIDGVHDSKALTQKKREQIVEQVMACKKLSWAVGVSTSQEIDKFGIRKATYFAMLRAYWNLQIKPDVVLVDGTVGVNKLPLKEVYYIPQGDARRHLVALASIVAKVYRDKLMYRYSKIYPGYGFERNVGYGTFYHKRRILDLGLCPIHRKSFIHLEKIHSRRNKATAF